MTKIHHFSSYGKRQEKYDLLNNTEFANVPWQELELKEPYYFFVPKDFGAKEKYDEGFSVSEIFREFNSGLSTDRDNLFIDFELHTLEQKITKLLSGDYDNNFIEEFNVNNSSSYNLLDRLNRDYDKKHINKILYRPLDFRFIYYDEVIISRPGNKIMKHLINKENLLLICVKQSKNTALQSMVTKNIICRDTVTNHSYGFPLYLYNQQNQNSLEEVPEKTPNFNFEIIKKIEEKLGMKMDVGADLVSAKSQEEMVNTRFTPTNLFDYIYAVLHSKTYRETYKEFLKIDFPKIHFDVTKETFFTLAKLGEEIRSYHLLENPNLIAKNFITKYEIDGDNKVEKVKFISPLDKGELEGVGNIFINETQYFANVPKNVWEFYIGGYQPAQKWLKDRKDRNLNYEDIMHYSKMILSLSETIRIMEEIEKIKLFKN